MSFTLSIPRAGADSLEIVLNFGETLFVVGANGTGKSNLMQMLFAQHAGSSRRISAHRQNWFSSEGINVSSAERRNVGVNIQNYDAAPESRFRDAYSSQRPNVAVYDLIDAEHVRDRTVTAAMDAGDVDLAQSLARKDAPIKVINELLRLSQIPIEISLGAADQVFASKNGSAPYSITQLSDGERNALLLAADVLTVPLHTLILIDEPERHLHRSIISPLLTLLFAKRPDCAFIVSTHEVLLPLDNQYARTLLLRGVVYTATAITGWDSDLLPPDAEIDETVKHDILGGRRKILFIEGSEHSLDKPLYSLIFPGVSVIAKAGSREVETSVVGIRSASTLHWIQAFGIVDNDRRGQDEINSLESRGVYALSVFSVESIYYHPELQHRLADRHATVLGGDATARLQDAENALISAVTPHVQRLSERVAEKRIRETILRQLPGRDVIALGNPVSISVDVAAEVAADRTSLENSLSNRDLVEIVSRYPVRETSALTDMARVLGFQNRTQYEEAIRKLLMDSDEARRFVKTLFGNLPIEIGTP
jgi:ABC-type ATPase involved in cell division